MSAPSFSIVTIVRNDLDGLKATLDSLKSQTYVDYESIVVDGASTDGTAEWARANRAGSRAVVVSEPDRGVYDAMNKGLGLASGDLVCFMNAGDEFARNDALEVLANSHASQGWDWAVARGQSVDALGRPAGSPYPTTYSRRVQTFWHYRICHQATFVRTELLTELGAFDDGYSIAGDYHAFLRLSRRSDPVLIAMVTARTSLGGVSQQDLRRAQLECHRARVDVFGMKWLAAGADWGMTTVSLLRERLYTQLGRARRRLASTTGHQP